MKRKVQKKIGTSDNTSVFIDNDINVNDRIIHLFDEIDNYSASNVIKGIQLMLKRNDEEPIEIYINSFGGCPYSAFSIHDFISKCPVTVKTFVTGCAMSGGSIVFMAGDERYMYENSVLMLHSVSSLAEGKVFLDMEDEYEECKKIHEQLCEIYANNSTKSKKQWSNLLKYKDKYYRKQESLKLGLITHEL